DAFDDGHLAKPRQLAIGVEDGVEVDALAELFGGHVWRQRLGESDRGDLRQRLRGVGAGGEELGVGADEVVSIAAATAGGGLEVKGSGTFSGEAMNVR
ncbi:MAG: hypothetical protein ABFD92_16300, partial [Planctomycetaceae bacterium]